MKILVVVMGVMLVVGVAALFAGVAYRLSHPRPEAAPAPPFVPAAIDLPTGARIETIGVGGDRIVLAIVRPDGARELVIIDLATGRRLGTIPLRPGP